MENLTLINRIKHLKRDKMSIVDKQIMLSVVHSLAVPLPAVDQHRTHQHDAHGAGANRDLHLQHRPTCTPYYTGQHVHPTTQANMYSLQHRPTGQHVLPTAQANMYSLQHRPTCTPYNTGQHTLPTTRANMHSLQHRPACMSHTPSITPVSSHLTISQIKLSAFICK